MVTNHGVIHADSGTDHPADSGHAHPTEKVYIKVAIILSLVTAIEVVIYYLESFEGILVPALLIMSAFKFVVVVGFFMHLKFDNRRLTLIFAGGLALALAIFLAAFATMHWLKVTEYTQFVPVG